MPYKRYFPAKIVSFDPYFGMERDGLKSFITVTAFSMDAPGNLLLDEFQKSEAPILITIHNPQTCQSFNAYATKVVQNSPARYWNTIHIDTDRIRRAEEAQTAMAGYPKKDDLND
ncbi:hypothetical protein CVH13_00277 [Dehalococcoides mccartyi]|uniref:Uncharacterized protein n=1 Tax=Dehalococcoides mccartyi TaxID=61435 RepID=A0A2J1E000_9CHLR|nr:hypothetical protein [Dehalococcoides mccartyi]AOV99522.1 hypothetical protein DCWBC2_0890 [Dehalococcoides mccartyi]MBF4483084.1 hypothetical protein [Dehalococcoides mccartyi]MBJ7531917.1 hypothetical protein [Dehalococcoides mccartyi]PKH47728.1 hypothetical protein CVH13_00277 [Dehalococcoides mccartyi]